MIIYMKIPLQCRENSEKVSVRESYISITMLNSRLFFHKMTLISLCCRYFWNFYKIQQLFTFIYSYMIEEILFSDQILKVEILMDLHVYRTFEYEDHTFSNWSVYVRLDQNIRAKKNYSKNSKFGIQHQYYMYMQHEIFL